MMRMKKLTCLLSIFFLLAGCVPTETIDDVQIIHAIGIDSLSDNKIRGTATFPIFNPDGTVRFEYLNAVSHTSRFLRSQLNTKSPKPLTVGQLRIVLFNKKFAERGVLEIVDSLYRDPNVGNRLFLAVSETDTYHLLTQKYGPSPLPSMYITETIDQNIKTENLPKTNLHVFLYSFYGEGIDPFLPLIASEDHTLKLKGVALFKNDKFVGKLNHKESFVFKILLDGSRTGEYEVKLKKGQKTGYGVIRNIKGRARYKLKMVDGRPQFDIHIKILGEIHEYPPWLNLELPRNVKLVEQAFNKEIHHQAEDMVNNFQKLGIDPLGLGDHVRRKERNWNEKKFMKQYSDMKVNVTTEVKIVESGVIE